MVAVLYAVAGLVVFAVRGPAAWPAADRLLRRTHDAPGAAPVDRRLGDEESEAVRRLMEGRIDRSAYRSIMAVVAAADAVAHPLAVPKLHQ
ncbi:hypothetical protein [Dactylosporangium fulvum]